MFKKIDILGALFILPVAGFVCEKDKWQMIFYISAAVAVGVLVIWIIFSADKPKHQMCISEKERKFIEKRVESQDLGGHKKRKIPWKALFTSEPLHAAIWGLLCHEYPMVLVLTVS